ITKGIFGASLKSASLCGSTSDFGLTVPSPVFQCFEEIIKREFDTPPTYAKYLDLGHNDIHAITGVVKKYLRHLPDPAIPSAVHDQFIQLYDERQSDQCTIKTLAHMIYLLPKEHFHLIYYITLLASKIQQHADTNMMNPEALATVLAPVCTGLDNNLKEVPSWIKRHSPGKIMTDMNLFKEINAKWTGIWRLMIEYSDTMLEMWEQISFRQVHTVPYHLSPFRSSPNLSHPQNRRSISFSALEQTESCLNPARRRPSYDDQRNDDLCRVIVMRRQSTHKLLNRYSSNSGRTSHSLLHIPS
ncbi:Rho GTPase activation protein, partial [Parasitella parasitica]